MSNQYITIIKLIQLTQSERPDSSDSVTGWCLFQWRDLMISSQVTNMIFTNIHDTRCYGVTYLCDHGVIYHCDYVKYTLHKDKSSMPTIYRLAKWINY